MTHRDDGTSPILPDRDITCDDVAARLAAYRRGELANQDAERLEAHAASCALCEGRLEQATGDMVSVAAFAPTPPPTLRAATLAAVTAQHVQARRQRRWRRWMGGSALLAAAAAVTFMITRPENPMPSRATSTTASTAATAATVREGTDAGWQLADAEARPEFAALEAAAAELAQALAASPDDRELAAFLATVRARRDELERRVRDAKS